MLQERNDIETDFVATEFVVKIGGVGDVVQMLLAEVGEDFLSGEAEERTNDMGIAGTNATESMEPSATDEVE